LLLVQPETVSRDHMVDSITPTWDGNETWIIMAGATLLAAFPVAYAILLPAFYLPIILMLLALGFRGVSVQFRVQSSSIVVLGGLMQGVQNQHFAGSVLDVVHPLAVISPRSPIRLCRTGRRMAQTEIKSVTANFCKSLHPCFGAVFCHPVRHSLYLCVKNPAQHPLQVGLTWNHSCTPCRLVCHCLGHFDDDDRES
jgi:hypothetical protein